MPCKPFAQKFDDCLDFEHEIRPLVVCRDHKGKSEYRYNNQSRNHLSLYRVDACLIADTGAKCDYLLLNCDQSMAFFIELKGSDLIQAVRQIDRAISLLSLGLKAFPVFHGRIALTRVNTTDFKNSEYLKLQKRLKALGGDLRQGSKVLSDTY